MPRRPRRLRRRAGRLRPACPRPCGRLPRRQPRSGRQRQACRSRSSCAARSCRSAGRSDVIEPDSLAYLQALEPQKLDEAVGLYHASPRDPVWEYVLSPLQAELCFDRMEHRVACVGHSHMALSYGRMDGTPASGDTCRDGAERRPVGGRVAVEPRQRGPAARRRPTRSVAAARHERLDGRLPPHRVRRRGRRRRDPRRAPAGLARRAALRTVSSVGLHAVRCEGVPLVVLGFAVALLVACGSGNGRLSGRQAQNLQAALSSVQSACSAEGGAAATAAQGYRRPRERAAGRHGRPQADREPAVRAPRRCRRSAPQTCTGRTTSTAATTDTTTTTPTTTATTVTTTTQPTTPHDPDPRPRPRPRLRRRRRPRRPTTAVGPPEAATGTATRTETETATATPAAARPVSSRSRRRANGRDQVFAGRYRCERRLGVGGMSTVSARARHARSSATWPSSCWPSTWPTTPRSWRASGARRWPRRGSCTRTSCRCSTSASTRPPHRHYIVMEYVDGQSCAEILRDRGPLDVARGGRASSRRPAAGSTTRTATASCTATSSPATCCATDDGSVKLADFGIAKAAEQTSHHPGRLGARHRRLPLARAGARRAGRPGLGPLLARRRRLPAPVRAAAVRGGVAHRAGAASSSASSPQPLDELSPRCRPQLDAGRRARARARPASARRAETADAMEADARAARPARTQPRSRPRRWLRPGRHAGAAAEHRRATQALPAPPADAAAHRRGTAAPAAARPGPRRSPPLRRRRQARAALKRLVGVRAVLLLSRSRRRCRDRGLPANRGNRPCTARSTTDGRPAARSIDEHVG